MTIGRQPPLWKVLARTLDHRVEFSAIGSTVFRILRIRPIDINQSMHYKHYCK